MNQVSSRVASSPVPFSIALVCASAALAACSASSGDSDAFRLRATSWSVGGNTKVAISGNNIAWIADEATTGNGGTDLNGDTIPDAGVAVYANAGTLSKLVVGVAAQDLVWIGSELYLVVSEATDRRIWNSDGDTLDTVLVHWSPATPAAEFVDELDPTSSRKVVAFGARLVYATADSVSGANASSLRTIDAAAPMTIVDVTTDDALGALHPSILLQEEGLVFVALNENVEARVLNGDGESTDSFVLGLLDLRTAAAPLRSVGLALPGTSSPLRAKFVATADWQVGFLVSESAQGATNLDDPASFAPSWQAPQCIGFGDTDTNDNVLHYLRFAAWVSDAAANPPRNTGLVGVDKIAIANGFIATITPESTATGTLGEGTCDLNGDGDKSDRVVRWTQMVAGTGAILPLNSVANIHALDDVAGGTHGLAELQERFVIVVDEQQDDLDLNGDSLKTFDLVGWLVPSLSVVPWQFLHGTAPNQAFVGASWVGETRDKSRLGVALQEIVGGISLNPGTTSAPGDNDIADSIPTFAVFGSVSTLTFPGVKIAVDAVNPGIVIANGLGYYRVAENADNRDWNVDNDKSDSVLFRSSFTQGTTSINGILNSITRPALEIDQESSAPSCGALLSEEALQGAGGFDINGDGDRMDLVLQFFVF